MQAPVAHEGPTERVAQRAGHEPTCSIRVLGPFGRYLARLGRSLDGWLGPYGLAPAQLAERDLRIADAQVRALVREAARLSGDPAIGVRAAREGEPGDFDVIEYAATNCATVGEALQLAARFIGLMHDGIAMSLDVAGPLAALRVRGEGVLAYEPIGVEFLWETLLAYGSRSLGRRTRPLRVDFTHAAPADVSVQLEAFREVRYREAENVMWVSAAALELPHCAPDPSLLQILTSHADALLRQLAPRPNGVAERARAAIASELSGRHPSAERTAKKLAISLRTLHRRLAEEGTSYGELVDEVRRAQALLHLGSERFSIGEISFLLGFAHPNAFHKAFKRWTQMTPAQYREQATRTPPVGDGGAGTQG